MQDALGWAPITSAFESNPAVLLIEKCGQLRMRYCIYVFEDNFVNSSIGDSKSVSRPLHKIYICTKTRSSLQWLVFIAFNLLRRIPTVHKIYLHISDDNRTMSRQTV